MTGFLSLKNVYLRYSAIFLALIYILIEASQNNDFIIFLSASEDLIRKINIYTVFYKGCYHYYYSPLFALALYPLTLLPAYFAKLLWLGLNLVFMFRTWKAMSFFLDRRVFNERQKLFFTVSCFLFVLYFLTENFHCGQMTVFILFLSAEGMYRIMTGRYWFGALLIALAINIKLLPLLLLPYLLYRGYLKASAWLVLFLCVLLVLPAPLIGLQYNTDLLKSWWALINPANTEHVIDTAERSFHSLSSWLPGLLMDHVSDPQVLPVKRNIANLDAKTVGIILNTIRALLLLLGLYFLRSLPFRRATSKLSAFRELAYLFLLVPLIFPHQQHYAFYFMLPAGTYMCYFLTSQWVAETKRISERKFKLLVAGMVVVFLTNNIQLLLGEFGQWYQHFKVITYGALLLIPMLAVSRPEEIPVRKEEEEREKGPGFY
ncbi:MAG TPA: glycosyltransferase family 87 protein [Bacteroidia bacterium]|nr:glycosyltransferase family 87 protein [Bacteroidia bacterium]